MLRSNNNRASRTLCALAGLFLVFLSPFSVMAQPDTKRPGKCYFIGTGPAGPEHATVKALECIRKADAYFCSESLRERFAAHLVGKTYLGNACWGDFKHKRSSDLEAAGPEAKKAYLEERLRFWDQTAATIRSEVAQGKTVAVLDSGDPCVFGPSHRAMEGLDEDEYEIIPGLGCFQASMAALKKSSIPAYDTRFVMLTAPRFLFGDPEDEAILADLSKYPVTIGLYMALRRVDTLMPTLRKYYPDDLPVAVVYWAGDSEKEKVLKGTLGTILEDIKAEGENWMGMIIIGRCLEGQPLRGMVRHMSR